MSAGERTAKAAPELRSDAEPLDYSVQEALLASIVASSDDAIVSKTLDGQIQSWNAGAARIFGYQADEVIGKPITIIVPPELHEEERRILEQVRRGKRIDHFDTIRVTKDGRRIPISLTVSPVHDSRGNVVGASKVARDISPQKVAEQALRESERRLAAEADALAKLVEWSTRLWRSSNLNDGLHEILVAVTGLLGAEKAHIQMLDPKAGTLTIVAQQGFEQEFLDVFRSVSAAHDSTWGRALRSEQCIVIEDVETDGAFEAFRAIARAAGFCSVVSTPLIRADGTPLGMVSTHFRLIHRPTEQELRRLDLYLRQATDFIQRCKMEQVLYQSEEALRDADRRKDEFLALLAHELRNPLAPIRYALAANKKANGTLEQQRRAEEVIERQVSHMSRLLDDLLDISRVTRGKLELKKGPCELTLVIGAAIETARPILDTKHHVLSLELPQQAVRLEADAVRLSQVFSNLLINAAKYTDPGGHIQLRATREGNDVVVAIRDDGIGISAEMLPRLFTMFSQADAALERAEGGLGIGLSLVRGLVMLHGGGIAARSDGIGRGSEFTVRIPAGTPLESPDVEASADVLVPGAGLKILVVDDSRDAADTCAILLELSGHHVQTAYTGQRALELAETFRPHVLLLDIGIPDIDGYQLAKKVRTSSWGRGAILIAVTGWGQEDDRHRAFAAGFDHHLTKPIAAETVELLIRSLGTLPEPAKANGLGGAKPHQSA
jgi:PAS domain S-box-containing protein